MFPLAVDQITQREQGRCCQKFFGHDSFILWNIRWLATGIENGGFFYIPSCSRDSSLPRAIILTHAHFDHRGSLIELAEEWGVPVYCHHQEKPYLTGKASYPPADPSVGGGVISLLSFTFPKGPIDASNHLRELPENGIIQELSDWKWLHTPGHTPGHISLFREKDGVLLAGDAFVTNMQESVLAVISQKKSVCGPPKYFTPDWGQQHAR